MELYQRLAERDRLQRGILAAVLTAAAVRSLRKGKRLSGALAAGGALLVGSTLVTGTARTPETFEPEPSRPSRESAELRCANCGQPIRLGERRGPNAQDRVVHDACADA